MVISSAAFILAPSTESSNRTSCTSITISVTNSELYFNWGGFGLNLHFHENSLPPDIDYCTIHIEASVEGDYVFPEDSYLVSAVYHFRCIPRYCKFSRLVTLEIQHCAKQEHRHQLSFVKSVGNQSQSIFSKTTSCSGGDHGIFPSCSFFGFIQLDSFCRYAVVQETSEERDYCARLYYLSQDINRFQIDFAVFWNTDTHNSVSLC